MKRQNKEIFELHADFCRTIGNSKRLMIIELLSKKEMSVGEITKAMDITISNVSQHLRTLKSHHVVNSRKEGQTV